MTLEIIRSAIPHREPFLLLDEIIEQTDTRIVCRKRFTGDEFWYRGHYPEFPLTPGVLLCEAAMQAGAVLLSKHPKGEGVPVAGRLNDVKFKRMVRPGDTITIETLLDERMGDAFFLSSKVACDGKVAATLNFAVTLAKRDAAGG